MEQKKSTLLTQATLATAYARMGMEANMVMGMRLMGMAGLWAMPSSEIARMIDEKQKAFGDSAMAATRSALAGGSPEAVARAALGPIGRETKANVKRLTKSSTAKPRAK